MTAPAASRRSVVARRVLTATVAWCAVYSLAVLIAPAALAHRALLSDLAFAPFHPLAMAMLWLASRSGWDPSRRRGLQLLAASQGFAVLNTVVWVLSSAGIVSANTPVFEYVGLAWTLCTVAGLLFLVPGRGVAGGIAVVPVIDAALLAVASIAVGWEQVGVPLLQSGAETASALRWLVVVTAADFFCALLALSAWAFPSRRLRADAALLLSLSLGMTTWLEIAVETRTLDGTYQSGGLLDIAFAVSATLLAIAAYLELHQAEESAVVNAQRAALVRLVLPTVATAALVLPLFDHASMPASGVERMVPLILLVLFVGLMQYRFILLERAAERALTQRLALERDLRLAQQFESLGRYAASVAHDMNNLLAALLAQVHVARVVGSGSDVNERLAEMERTLESGTTLTRRLMQMSRGGPTAAVPVDLSRAARNMALTVRRLLPENVQLHVQSASIPVIVALRPGDADQVLLNLVVNARDALPRGGNITVSVQLADGRASLEVADDGEGIPPHLMSRIFEPFFTTKNDRGGTGLGLSTVQSIVAQSQGALDVVSDPGTGTRFTIRWPVSAGS